MNYVKNNEFLAIIMSFFDKNNEFSDKISENFGKNNY
jgi:hypothetical protein